jgi:NiFe hydrogenase small subunit HydA
MKNLLYLQGLSCGGETISLLNAEEPGFISGLHMLGISIAWHPSLSETEGEEVRRLCRDFIEGKKRLDFLVVEGAVATAPQGTGKMFMFIDEPFLSWVRELAGVAEYTLAAGTCAASGGIPASGVSPAAATGLQFHRDAIGGALGEKYRSRSGCPVINIPGCPAHPDWILQTLSFLAEGELNPDWLDDINRPAIFYQGLAHHGCPRNEFYEFKSSATAFGQMGCLFEFLGCRGTQCESDCNNRLWLGRTGSCTRGGFPCIACTSQKFPAQTARFFTTEMTGNIPSFLPLDVPKAWYIGITGLSKMAMPHRLKLNSVSCHPVHRNAKGRGASNE